jgi:chromosome segregation ATPase
LKRALDKSRQRRAEHRKRHEEAEKNHALETDSLKAKHSESIQKYSECLEKVTAEKEQLAADLTKAIDEIQQLEQSRANLRIDKVNLEVKARTLALKVEDLSRALDQERNSFAAKKNALTNAIKVQYDAKFDELVKQIEAGRQSLIGVLTNVFNLSKFDESIEKVIELTNEEVDARSGQEPEISDCLRLRRLLGCGPQRSLVDVFKEKDAEIQNNEIEIAELTDKLHSFTSNEAALKRQLIRLEQMKTDNAQWTIWGRTLLGQLASPKDANLPGEEVRNLLEQIFLTAIGQRSVTRKIDILRAEKKLLKLPRYSISVGAPKKPVNSLRPLMLTYVFTNKLRVMTGTAKLRFAGSHAVDDELPG